MDQRLQGQPLGGEAVQRRHAGDRHRADQEGAAGPRHPPQQAAEPVEVERADRSLEGARGEEEQRLEDGVVEHVQQRRGEGDRRPGRLALGGEEDRGAEAERDDADVLDRVEGEQPLEVVLDERVEDAAERREQADGEDDQPDPERRRRRPLEEDADEAVEGDLDHHPRHQRRDVARRHRVGAGQPGVQRHQPGLGAEADQRGDQHQRLDAGALRGERARVGERPVVGEGEDRDPDPGAAEVGDREVDEDRVADGRLAARAAGSPPPGQGSSAPSWRGRARGRGRRPRRRARRGRGRRGRPAPRRAGRRRGSRGRRAARPGRRARSSPGRSRSGRRSRAPVRGRRGSRRRAARRRTAPPRRRRRARARRAPAAPAPRRSAGAAAAPPSRSPAPRRRRRPAGPAHSTPAAYRDRVVAVDLLAFGGGSSPSSPRSALASSRCEPITWRALSSSWKMRGSRTL